MSMSSQAPQALHPSIIPRLDPEYIAFHEAYIQQIVPPHTLPWDPAIRTKPAVPGEAEPLKAGKVEDYEINHTGTKMRSWTPKGEVPEEGWPVVIYFHGGEWMDPRRNFQRELFHLQLVYASSVVLSVDYRLAPEIPYPAAVQDAVDALDWVLSKGPDILKVDLKRIAVAGSSSGANLATVLALKSITHSPPLPHPIIFQLLVVPVTDNTLTTSNSDCWSENASTAWLSPGRMEWFRNHYLPNEEDRRKWDASPIFAPSGLLEKLPKSWIAVAELDILRDEGIKYGMNMMEAGVDVEIIVYKKAPHPIMSMDGDVLKIGKQLVSDAAAALKAEVHKQK